MGVTFFLGTHMPNWLALPMFEDVPLFVSRRTLGKYKSLPKSVTRFALDSGGFTELQMYGKWTISPDAYADEVLHYRRHFGQNLMWAAPQDWMCEPIVISGGVAARGVRFAGSRLSVAEHQVRTVDNFCILRKLLGDLVIPVVQGWNLQDYCRHTQMYTDAGVNLSCEQTVGVGSVCRRQSTEEVTEIISMLRGEKIRVHGFGFKKHGLRNCHTMMTSADSMAWSDVARKEKILLAGHDTPGQGRRTGHKNCANCPDYALIWRSQLLSGLESIS